VVRRLPEKAQEKLSRRAMVVVDGAGELGRRAMTCAQRPARGEDVAGEVELCKCRRVAEVLAGWRRQ
jgi:hypothetical protein